MEPGKPSTRAERLAAGQAALLACPLECHAQFEAPSTRDPVGLLLRQAESRVPELVPVRHGRMLVSPMAYFRGAALPMAADLVSGPDSGLRVQLCGDAHLSNFGAFASPERRLVFDLNDFDETLPGPFEWDVKRLAASFAVAGRENGFSAKQQRKVVVAAVGAYRSAVRSFADQPLLDVWYARLDVEEALAEFSQDLKKKQVKAGGQLMSKIRTRDSMQALGKLTTVVDGRRRIISDPPLVVPVEELAGDLDISAIYQTLDAVVHDYRQTLQSDRRHLLDQFTLEHMAHKVVGVGSVGTRAWILLLQADDGETPLFLQAKQAQASVLADYAGPSQYDHHGQRVVAGQHLMQAVSDIFLGWQRVTQDDGTVTDYYVRQLRDWKFSAPVERMTAQNMTTYASICAWTLARSHARTGDRVAISAYLGESDRFDQAVADFAAAYADLNERDFDALAAAARTGRIQASSGV
jgi:uncharacterized protein (DUF2252 family)